jgi:CRISPR-associated exonuclease Cas4
MLLTYLVALILIFLVFGILILLFSKYLETSSGIPSGKIIEIDLHHLTPESKPMFDPIRKLTGRPDYLVENNKQIIPVEIKKGQQVIQPYQSHIYQLAAYLSLVESTYGKRPSFGILHYNTGKAGDRNQGVTYAIDNTPEMQKRLDVIIQEIRKIEQTEQVNRSHYSPKRCSGCGYRSLCDQRL